ncbi:MAG: DUF4235 domain-containing protein [Stackebrandtia sp.]
MNKLLLKPVTMLSGVAAGVVAGIVVKKVWRGATGKSDTPDATDLERSWPEVVAAAALQGAVFAMLKALFDHAGASAVQRLSPDYSKDE